MSCTAQTDHKTILFLRIQFLLFRLTDKPISFEMSLGNAGNSLDGQLQTMTTQNEDGEMRIFKKKLYEHLSLM